MIRSSAVVSAVVSARALTSLAPLALLALLLTSGCSGEVQGSKQEDSDRGPMPSPTSDAAASPSDAAAAPSGKGAAPEPVDGGTGKGSAPASSGTAPSADPTCAVRCSASLGRVCGDDSACASLCTKATAQSLACLEQLTTCDKVQLLGCFGVTPTPPGPGGK